MTSVAVISPFPSRVSLGRPFGDFSHGRRRGQRNEFMRCKRIDKGAVGVKLKIPGTANAHIVFRRGGPTQLVHSRGRESG